MIIMRLAGTVFGIVCLFHLLRVIMDVDVVIGGWLLPIWVNWVGFFGTAALCVGLWYFSGKKK